MQVNLGDSMRLKQAKLWPSLYYVNKEDLLFQIWEWFNLKDGYDDFTFDIEGDILAIRNQYLLTDQVSIHRTREKDGIAEWHNIGMVIEEKVAFEPSGTLTTKKIRICS